jgi:hypothetical protein
VPVELADVPTRVGAGLAHIRSGGSIRPIAGNEHSAVGHRLAYWLACFIQDADRELLYEGFERDGTAMNLRWRAATALRLIPGRGLLSVATPSDPSVIARAL